jgi:hypothetical protein
VIDPGHGGADSGTAHNGLVEKQLTLDIALRLRALLAQAGWHVRLTRDTDIDPVSPALLSAFGGDGRPNQAIGRISKRAATSPTRPMRGCASAFTSAFTRSSGLVDVTAYDAASESA